MTVDVFVGEVDAYERARRDVEQFSALYSATRAQLVGYCRSTLRGRGDPEVAAQDAFLKAWRAFGRYEQDRPFWPWLATIARQVCMDQLRHESVVHNHADAIDLHGAPSQSPEELFEMAEEGRLALLALGQIAPQQQRLVGLRDIEGWSYEHIAEFEGITVEAVRGKLRRARQRLRLRFEELLKGMPAFIPGLMGARVALKRRLAAASDRARLLGQTATASAPALGHLGDAVVALVVVAVLGGGPAATSDRESLPTSPASATAGDEHGTSAQNGDPSWSDRSSLGGLRGSHDNGPSSSGSSGIGVPGLPTGAPSIPSAQPPSDGGDGPQDVTFKSLVPSPSGGSDGLLFATGTVGAGCSYPPCMALFRSDDAGRTWERLPAVGYAGGTVLLPPAFPVDPRIFVAGTSALQVSDDGGQTFRPLTSVGGPATISPNFDTGDPTILIGTAPGWLYRADTGHLEPLALTPPPAGSQLNFAFAGTNAEGAPRLLVGAIDPTQGSPNASVVDLCSGSTCRTVAALTGAQGAPQLVVSTSFAQDHTVLAWRDDQLSRSVDGGSTFSPVALPAPGQVQAITDDGAGNFFVAVAEALTPGVTQGGLFTSHDSGATWSRVGGGTPLDSGVLAVVAIAGGELLAAPASTDAGGLFRSSDGGDSWQQAAPGG